MEKSADAFRTISEAAEELEVPQHVLRFWETRFSQIKPMKRGGGRRYYRPEDMELLRSIRHLLYGEGYTIRGVQRLLKEKGIKAVIAMRKGAVIPPMPMEPESDLQEAHDEEHAYAVELDERVEPSAGRSAPSVALAQDERHLAREAYPEPAYAPAEPAPDVEPLLRALLADIDEARRLLRTARAA